MNRHNPKPPRSGGGGGYHHGGGYYHRPYHPYYPYYGYYGWPWYWGGFWSPWYWGWGWGWGPRTVYVESAAGAADAGAVDCDVSPEEARVYVDGRDVGEADSFDGYPSYLWLPEGEYELAFYHSGYETLVVPVSVYAGSRVRIRDRMVRGEAVMPEVRQRPPSVAQGGGDDAGAWDEAPGRLHFRVEPEDASVYLDGRFLGTGGELEGLHAGLLVSPGRHRIEVVRPGYEAQAEDLEVAPGGDIRLAFTLVGES